jgi:ribosome maturation factor RimP
MTTGKMTDKMTDKLTEQTTQVAAGANHDTSQDKKSSSSSSVSARLEALASSVAEREGCLLYDIEFLGTGQGRTLRVFIDKVGGGVGIEDCSRVSQGLNLLLDVEDVIPGGAYNLEVSTPGLERLLKKSWHFQQAVGKLAKLRLSVSADAAGISAPGVRGHKSLTVTIEGISVQNGEEILGVSINGESFSVPLIQVERAQLIFEFSGQAKKSHKPGVGKKSKAKNKDKN